ncbi:MAG: UPF0149 family protein [Quisquiliibacterium sp.]
MNPERAAMPMSDELLAELDALLSAIDPDESMAVEELDGFFAGLACCPEPVPAEEYLPEILACQPDQAAQRIGAEKYQRLRGLLERHRESMAGQLYEGEGIAPVLGHDEDDKIGGNAWAIGFVRAMALRPDAWSAMDEDDEQAQALDPLMRLVQEVEPPEGEQAEPIQDDERDEAIGAMLEGVMQVYEFLAPAREKALAPAAPLRRDQPKVGRNDPCPCGSGRKYKACHGAG